jgi:hypothetical protein
MINIENSLVFDLGVVVNSEKFSIPSKGSIEIPNQEKTAIRIELIKGFPMVNTQIIANQKYFLRLSHGFANRKKASYIFIPILATMLSVFTLYISGPRFYSTIVFALAAWLHYFFVPNVQKLD